MTQLISLITYLLVGFVEMFLVTQRTAFISRNKRKSASVVVLLENVITFFVILQLAQNINQNIPNFVAYCVGSCSGTILDIENFTYDKIMRRSKKIWRKISMKKQIEILEVEVEAEM